MTLDDPEIVAVLESAKEAPERVTAVSVSEATRLDEAVEQGIGELRSG